MTSTYPRSKRLRVGHRAATYNSGLEARSMLGRHHGLPASPGTPASSSPPGPFPYPEARWNTLFRRPGQFRLSLQKGLHTRYTLNAMNELMSFLATHQALPLDEDVERELDRILKRARHELCQPRRDGQETAGRFRLLLSCALCKEKRS